MTDGHRTVRVAVSRPGAAHAAGDELDEVVIEEPLEIRVDGESVVVTMRTPGDDLDLARGLLFSEGFVGAPQDIVGVRHCTAVDDAARGNVVIAALAPGVTRSAAWSMRATAMSAACGLCGRRTLDAVRLETAPVGSGPRLTHATLLSLPERLRAAQAVFAATGGLHAAGLFDRAGRLLVLKEDVGRHNAVDKVIGEAMRFGRLPLGDSILMLSGRAGFELVQKAVRAGIPVVCSVSAPSSLAVQLARESNQTLVGFLRGERYNVYCGAQRIEA